MRLILSVFLLANFAPCLIRGQSSPAQQSSVEAGTAAGSAPVIQTEKVQVPESAQAPPESMSSQPGYMLPAQSKEMLTKIWQAESRLRDLIGQVQPEVLQRPAAAAGPLESEIKLLGKNLGELETARAKFSGRVDSEYLGFETYAAMAALLPPLGQVAETVSRDQSRGLGGELRQAWNDFVALEEALKPYISFLTRNHDEIFALTQGNLYNCQTQLSAAMRDNIERAKPIHNIVPEFKGTRVRKKTGSPQMNERE